MRDASAPDRLEDRCLPFDEIVHAYRSEICCLAMRGRSAQSITEILVAALSEMGYAQAAVAANFQPQIEALLVGDRGTSGMGSYGASCGDATGVRISALLRR